MDLVAQVIRDAANQALLPRYKALRDSDVHEKSPGEIVTAADRACEALLSAQLTALLPGSAVLGEEASSDNPQLRTLLQRAGAVWVVDPLDGTANFVAGSPCFSVMVALVSHGVTQASWMLDPLTQTLHSARRGAGAWVNGVPSLRAPGTASPMQELRGAVLTRYLPEPLHSDILARTHRLGAAMPGLRCAGHEYPDIAEGRQHFALFWRTEPWDHLPGALYLTETGGHVARLDGTEYRPGTAGAGLLAAQNASVWSTVQQALLEAS